jgi:zinc transporter ZupT
MSWTLLAYTVTIWLVGLAGVLAPLVMASYNKVVLTLCNSFAAGVMLSAGFVHLLHDAVSSLSGLQKKMDGYPISEFVCALSFICVFYVETLFSPPVKPGEHHHLDHIQVDKGTECFPSQWEWQAGQSPTRAAGTRPKHKGKQQEGETSPPLPQYGAVVPPSTAPTAATAGGLSGPSSNSSSGDRKGGKKTLSPPQKRIPTGPTTRLLEGTGNGHPDEARAAAAEAEDGINPHLEVRTGLLAHMQHTYSHHVDLEDSAIVHGHHHDGNAGARATSSTQESSSSIPSSSSSSSSSAAQAHSHNHAHNLAHGGGEVDALGLPLQGHKDLHTLAGALCLLAALGFHSVIEGLGLATASSQKDATQVGVFLAILAHKGLAGKST